MALKQAILGMVLAIAPYVATAGEQPVVIELYTSQGCSSCPPVDELLTKLTGYEDVLPLALHVDYWDYIGWKDDFGDPAHTKRQKAYARAAGQRTIYTPQMIVGGVDHVVGYEPMQVMDLIQKHKVRPDRVDLDVTRQGDTLRIGAAPVTDASGPFAVQLVRFLPQATVRIERGENAGKTLTYSNIVTDWKVLGTWDGKTPLSVEASADGPAAIIVQRTGHGAIVGAARLN